jgi:hypothetical protein
MKFSLQVKQEHKIAYAHFAGESFFLSTSMSHAYDNGQHLYGSYASSFPRTNNHLLHNHPSKTATRNWTKISISTYKSLVLKSKT